MKFALLIALSLFGFSQAHAAAVANCTNLDRIEYLMAPAKTFANGTVRLAYVSTDEPVNAPDHLLVFVYGDDSSVTCFSVNDQAGRRGFATIEFNRVKTADDGKDGLTVVMPVKIWAGIDGKYNSSMVSFLVSQKLAQPSVTILK